MKLFIHCLLLNALFFGLQLTASAQVVVVPKYDAKSYLGQYELVKEGVFKLPPKNGIEQGIVVTIKRTDKKAAPAVAFVESNDTIKPEDLLSSTSITVTLHEDGKRLEVTYFDKNKQPFFKSTLDPF